VTGAALLDPTGALDLPRLVDLCRTEEPELVANTRDEAMRRAAYLRGLDSAQQVAQLKVARICEWEMAQRWPATNGARRNDDRPVIDASVTGNVEAWQRIYAVGAQPFDWIASRTEPEQLTQAAIIRGPQNGPPPISVGGAIEWYTPRRYVEAARQVMGGIDTDPASTPVAQLTVRAGTYYTAETDGLRQLWHGSVWLNPPYRAELISAFVSRVVDHAGQWTVLTNNGTDTVWGQSLLNSCDAVCFPDHRIRFLNEDNEPQGPAMQGQMFTYRGLHVERFRGTFAEFGIVL
jgi:hypothetical protein